MGMTRDEEGGELSLNNKMNDEPHIDRGAELLLRRRSKQEPKTFQINFDKMISCFKRKFHLSCDIIFDIKKQE